MKYLIECRCGQFEELAKDQFIYSSNFIHQKDLNFSCGTCNCPVKGQKIGPENNDLPSKTVNTEPKRQNKGPE